MLCCVACLVQHDASVRCHRVHHPGVDFHLLKALLKRAAAAAVAGAGAAAGTRRAS
jgi:hypothetical protein